LNQDISKLNAAKEAIKLIDNGMLVGLGTGSTAKIAVDLIGGKLSDEFQIVGMPTSKKTELQAKELGIKLIGIDDADTIDIAIDGADEVAPDLSLIKGLGGALLREKKVEKKAKKLIIIVDETKIVDKLGVGFLPVEVTIENHKETMEKLANLGCAAELRIESNLKAFVTDNGNYIYHCKFEKGINNPEKLDRKLMQIDGVVDTGLFINMTTKVIVGTPNGTKIID
tara:strand:+ start:355 stop:1032 length:678 start_codon:yes stop_codon:yes gene_type:complete